LEALLLTGQGLIGKLALFIAEKLISHKLAISLDETKRVCRAFVEFYYCLDRLEELTSRVIEVLNLGIKHGGILIGDLELVMPAVNTVSQRFIEARGELYYALDLIDPSLASAVSQIYAAKGSFLLLMSDGVRYRATDSGASIANYYAPDSRILEIDMDAYEQWVAHCSATAKYDRDKLEWPQSLLWFGEFEEGFHASRLLLTDKESLGRLRSVLVDHGSVLSSAREKMRKFIATKFATEDILYVSKGMHRDEF
jgi:hypothetical protein